MTALEPAPGAGVTAPGTVADYMAASRANSTARAYKGDVRAFVRWCKARGITRWPAAPDTVAEWVADMARSGLAAATISRRLAGLSIAHQLAGHESPTRHPLVRRTLEGVRRTIGTAPHQHAPATIGEIRRMVAYIDPGTLAGARDRALLLCGFALAARRSELAALTVADLEPRPEGLVVHIRRSKTDQHARGTVRALPRGTDTETCPVAALEHWMTLAGITTGPLFRSITRWGRVADTALHPAAVARVVKQRAELAGFDPNRYAGHSLRAGFVTTAAARGLSDRAIAHQTGHAPGSRVLHAYIRHLSVFTDNAVTGVGL